ncbi:cell wall metabolism sensor histidine kinase WalK [Kocuria palustris]|uniref:sensor histidine kinase n=1 Tax=Kocuria palustris TaxID=71999 RepID=UPI0011A755D6|nr:ATP-binding protein [Kocuria palustris]
MDPLLLALLSGLIGLLLGLSGLFALRGTSQRRVEAAEVGEPQLPAGAADVLSVMGRAYVVVDGVDGVVRASPAAYAFGLVRGHSVVLDELLAMIRAARTSGVTEERRVEIGRGAEHAGVIVLDVRVAVLGDEFVLLLADDQTEIERAQSVRSDFVANVSHELKTPVGAIRLLSEAIEDAAEDEDAVRHFASRLHRESERLTLLVQDIIELSRLQGQNVVTSGGPVALDRVVAEAVDRNRMTAESRDIALVIGGSVDAPAFGDADMLTTALRNLIDNAIRYSPPGTRVGIGLRRRDDMALIAVTDQGPGIAETEQGRVFERFYRVDSARSRQTGGTGLGLSIVKHVMQQHGGLVDMWSEPGQGSTFTLHIPLMSGAEHGRPDDGQAADAAASAQGAEAAGTDDAPSGRRGLRPVRTGQGRREGGESA